MVGKVKLWKIGEADWLAAETKEDAIRLLGEMIGEDEAKDAAEDECSEVSDEEMETLVVHEKEFGEEGFEESGVTFRQSLDKMIADGRTFPTHFCTNDY